METKTYKFRVTAKIVKDIEVEMDASLPEDEAREMAAEQANEIFNPNCDGIEEKYTQDCEPIIED